MKNGDGRLVGTPEGLHVAAPERGLGLAVEAEQLALSCRRATRQRRDFLAPWRDDSPIKSTPKTTRTIAATICFASFFLGAGDAMRLFRLRLPLALAGAFTCSSRLSWRGARSTDQFGSIGTSRGVASFHPFILAQIGAVSKPFVGVVGKGSFVGARLELPRRVGQA